MAVGIARVRDVAAPGSAAALSADKVSKNFVVDGRPFQALANISLSVASGEFVSIVGPSGCGKSTLLRLFAGLDTADHGTVSVDGRIITAPSLKRGIVFQDHRLLPWLTVEQNILLALRRSALPQAEKLARVDGLLKLVSLGEFRGAHPHQLSGGMSQRAAFARSLAPAPDVLLLDEPLGALDSLTRAQMQTELLRIWERDRITTLMVTHDIDEAVLMSDRIIVMESRPGGISAEIDVSIQKPKNRSSQEFFAIKTDILRILNLA
jgi:ABC-type nitrate/sulfonate/bicarbonate transport system ATPase subunit